MMQIRRFWLDCRQTAPYAWGGIPVIRQRPCDGPEKPCRKPTFEDRSNRQGGMCTNSLNHVNYSTPGTNVSGANFGVITGAGTMRQVQLGGRITF